jgi:hypothetical protein
MKAAGAFNGLPRESRTRHNTQPQGIACWRCQIRPDSGMTDNSPADTGANNESVFCRKEFHNFAVFRS